MTKIRISVAALLFLAPLAFSQRTVQPTAIEPKQFAVMAWGDSPSDAGQLRGMKEAGLNISGFCRAEDLDRVTAAGLTCFVNDPKLSGYAPEQLLPVAIMRQDIAALKKQIGDNPAALGFYLRDEPSASLMPGLGRLATLLREEMPDKWPYVNLFRLCSLVYQPNLTAGSAQVDQQMGIGRYTRYSDTQSCVRVQRSSGRTR